MLVYSQFRLLGESLTRYLGECAHVARVKFCHRAERLVDGVIEIDADVVLFDMTNERAVDEARAVGAACPQVRLVALGIPEVSDKVIACADAGFTGYIPNRVSLDELVQAMDQALQGGLVCNPQIAGSLLREVWKRRSNKTDRGSVELLTARESDVLALVARGMSNKEIAHQLSLSVATVKNHLHNVFAKLHVNGRTEALARVRNEPWIVRIA